MKTQRQKAVKGIKFAKVTAGLFNTIDTAERIEIDGANGTLITISIFNSGNIHIDAHLELGDLVTIMASGTGKLSNERASMFVKANNAWAESIRVRRHD